MLTCWLSVCPSGFCQVQLSDRPSSTAVSTRAILDQLAASLHALSGNSTANSVYIQTNKDVYERGEDLWFKTHVLNAQTFQPATSDSILYLTLQRCDSDSLLWQEMYPVIQGITTGHVYLSPQLAEGDYWLKGYTSHSTALTGPLFYACRKIRIVNDLSALLAQSGTAHLKKQPDPSSLVFTLFPEGGQLIAGQSNTLAFKAIDKAGNPINVRGQLLENNQPVADLQTTHDGMGKLHVSLTATARYSVRLTQPAIDTLFSLPEVHAAGMSLQVQQNSRDTLVVNVIGAPLRGKEKVYVRLQVRGLVQAMASALLTGQVTLRFPLHEIPAGIAELTLFDEQLRPRSERLVYLRYSDRLHIDYQLRKDTFSLREKVVLTLKTTDQHGRAVPAVLGLTVFDDVYETYGQPAIDTYYYLTTQLRGVIHNPQYYVDERTPERAEALDLLLLTQGWRCYTWQEENLRAAVRSPLTLHNFIEGKLQQTGKARKGVPGQSFILAFNAGQTEKVMLPLEQGGLFRLPPTVLSAGRRLYLKHFGENGQFRILPDTPFARIARTASYWQLVYPAASMPSAADRIGRILETERARYTLSEVTVRAKHTTGFRDKYAGSLDSLARLDGPSDYVGACGLLNCPACGSGTKPVEGKQYSEYIGNRRHEINAHPFAFSGNEMQRITYHYRHYTEAELLAKFNLISVNGFYSHKAFYEPVYDQLPDSTPDFRNTLIWLPLIQTDENGEATVSFFTADYHGQFTGRVEGITAGGLPGKTGFQLQVQRRPQK